jgi:transposase
VGPFSAPISYPEWGPFWTPITTEHDAPHGSELGTTRWVVERTIAWLRQFRRLRIRYERRGDIHQAFLTLGCILICFRTLDTSSC